MLLRNLRNFLVRFLSRSKRKDDPSNFAPGLSEKSRLLHRLNCISLDEEEVKCLQGYLTKILEARHQDKTSGLASTSQSNCLVLEMSEDDFQEFVSHIGGNGICLFRALVQSDNHRTSIRKLTIVGEHGLHVFHVLIQARQHLLQN